MEVRFSTEGETLRRVISAFPRAPFSDETGGWRLHSCIFVRSITVASDVDLTSAIGPLLVR